MIFTKNIVVIIRITNQFSSISAFMPILKINCVLLVTSYFYNVVSSIPFFYVWKIPRAFPPPGPICAWDGKDPGNAIRIVSSNPNLTRACTTGDIDIRTKSIFAQHPHWINITFVCLVICVFQFVHCSESQSILKTL